LQLRQIFLTDALTFIIYSKYLFGLFHPAYRLNEPILDFFISDSY